MFKKIARGPRRALELLGLSQHVDNRVDQLDRKLDTILFAQGVVMARANRALQSDRLQDFEFKVFSQFGEDGIIQHLTSQIALSSRTFIEFGVEDFMESNCRFLLEHDDWSGFTIDGSRENVERTRRAEMYWRNDLNSVCAFVTRENISDLLRASGFGAEIGILSIDLDGIDYHIWAELDWIRPAIMIAEFNSVFGSDRAITVPYDPSFDRGRRHFSHLYFGCSLSALDHLARGRGYSLVGSTSQGVNAFWVRDDLMPAGMKRLNVAEAYVASRHRESRDEVGNLTFVAGDNRLELIRGLPVVNVVTGEIEPL